MITKVWAYIAGAAVILLLAYGGCRWWQGRQVAVHVRAADQFEVQQAAAGAEATTHEQTATNLKPTLQSNAMAVAQADATVAHLQHPPLSPHPGPNQPATDPQPVQTPVDLAALDAAKDTLIQALRKANADLAASNAAWEAGDTARQTQVRALQGEVVQLRAALAAMPRDLKWASGAVYGTNTMGDTAKGAFVDRDLSVLRTGIEVTQNTYAIASRVGWEARIKLGIRF